MKPPITRTTKQGFTWERGILKHLEKMLYREQRQLATNHPDKMIAMPEECKRQKNNEPLIETRKEKLIEDWKAYNRKQVVPTVQKEKRLNRL